MLRDLIEKYDLTVVNNEPICCGKWTRIRLCYLFEPFKILYTGNGH